MALNIRDYTIIKGVQSTHHQGDLRYGISRGIQCSRMSLMYVTWTMFKSAGIWDKYDLDYILSEGNQLFKPIERFRYLGIGGLPKEFLIENSSINLEFLEDKTWEITAGAYLISISEIVNRNWRSTNCQQLYFTPNLWK